MYAGSALLAAAHLIGPHANEASLSVWLRNEEEKKGLKVSTRSGGERKDEGRNHDG